ncbi:MAG: hypothetical protein IH999_11495 [Proteobacteria bacterium]|nr:hypothetical protein [Pseudomonadota bacterium]
MAGAEQLNPLEQFEIHRLIPIEIGGVDDHAFDYFSVAVEFAPIAIEVLPEAALEPGRDRVPSTAEWQVGAGKGFGQVTTTPQHHTCQVAGGRDSIQVDEMPALGRDHGCPQCIGYVGRSIPAHHQIEVIRCRSARTEESEFAHRHPAAPGACDVKGSNTHEAARIGIASGDHLEVGAHTFGLQPCQDPGPGHEGAGGRGVAPEVFPFRAESEHGAAVGTFYERHTPEGHQADLSARSQSVSTAFTA